MNPDNRITLTVDQIIDLAKCVGILPDQWNPAMEIDLESLDCEYTIEYYRDGIELIEDDVSSCRYQARAFITEYPEEGSFPLGKKI